MEKGKTGEKPPELAETELQLRLSAFVFRYHKLRSNRYDSLQIPEILTNAPWTGRKRQTAEGGAPSIRISVPGEGVI